MGEPTWQVEPLGRWSRPVTTPRASSGRFRVGWNETRTLLLREIEHLRPNTIIAVRVDVADAGQIRRDGMLSARARVEFPGVVVSFTSALHGPLTYATDVYEQRLTGDLPGWQADLRAIALSPQALRAVDRWGVTRSGEQYAGWRAIEATPSTSARFATADEALLWMQAFAGVPNAEQLSGRAAYKAAARLLHPDTGSDPDMWHTLDDARRLVNGTGLW